MNTGWVVFPNWPGCISVDEDVAYKNIYPGVRLTVKGDQAFAEATDGKMLVIIPGTPEVGSDDGQIVTHKELCRKGGVDVKVEDDRVTIIKTAPGGKFNPGGLARSMPGYQVDKWPPVYMALTPAPDDAIVVRLDARLLVRLAKALENQDKKGLKGVQIIINRDHSESSPKPLRVLGSGGIGMLMTIRNPEAASAVAEWNSWAKNYVEAVGHKWTAETEIKEQEAEEVSQ